MTSCFDISQDEQAIRAYLSFGYLPRLRLDEPFAILEGAGASSSLNEGGKSGTGEQTIDADSAIRKATEVLGSLAEQTVTSTPNGHHVVLLSGGLDSRAILGSLLKGVDRSRITACTYGYASNEELELATRVARAAGVEHQRILVPETEWSTEELINSARSRPYPPSFVVGARYQNHRIYKAFGRDCTYWDGMMGDAVTGAHLKQPFAPTSWADSVNNFARNAVKVELTDPNFDMTSALPARPLCDAGTLAFDDQLDIAVRQTCYISNRVPSDYRTSLPFAQGTSWRFWLALPREFRFRQTVYKQALARAFPRLYAIPAAGGRGAIAGSRWRKELDALSRRLSKRASRMIGAGALRHQNPHRRTGDEMRENKLLRAVISENIADLVARRLITWMDPGRLWADHLAGVQDYTEALRVLTSLEICLKLGASSRSGPSKEN